MQGVALVAGSPVRHDSPLGLAPLEVTAYQPPWKALSDFALHTDLDQGGPPHGPAFQHLVNQVWIFVLSTFIVFLKCADACDFENYLSIE